MKDRSLVQIALYAALFAVLGLIPRIDVPIAAGVPITAQSLGAMLAGVMLGARRGALAVLLFLFVVALGAPLLAGGRGGLGAFFSPTAGFLAGWVAGAFVAGWIMQSLRAMPVFASAIIAAVVGGILVVYTLGIAGMVLKTGMSPLAALSTMLVFIPGDLIKAVLAALVAQTVARGLPEALLSRQA
ncbi:biotin transporter BioY [Ancylobacter terrae]|uniref:biotin transporter BioY n=1 Tax=Ancylobacter sp. sgz301288 TaxID=3342077 RepID=UPI0038588BB9